MYTDTQQALRNSLWNFMGSLLANSAYENDKAKESVTALVSEELCKFCKNEDEVTVNMGASKPILKATTWILQARIQEMKTERDKLKENSPAYEYLSQGIDDLTSLFDSLENFISKI